MSEHENAVFLMSQVVCAQAEIAGMVAENDIRKSRGEAMAYNESHFREVPIKYGIHHNEAITTLRGEGA